MARKLRRFKRRGATYGSRNRLKPVMMAGSYSYRRGRMMANGRVDSIRAPHRYVRWANLQTAYSVSSTNAGVVLSSNLVAGSPAFNAGLLNYQTSPAIGTTYVGLSYALQLQGLPNFTEFTSLYDTYRITGYAVSIIPMYNTYNAQSVPYTQTGVAFNSNGGVSLPIIHSVIDFDDNAALNLTSGDQGVDTLRQYASYKVSRLDGNNKIWRRYIRLPSTNVGVQEMSLSTGVYAAQKRSPRLDAAAVDVNHYGLKLIIENSNFSQAYFMTFKVEVKAYIQMFQPR